MSRRIVSLWQDLVGELGPAQSAVVLASTAVGGAGTGLRASRESTPARGVVIAGVAVDLVGGLVAFQLAPTRESYRAHDLRSRLAFAVAHVQPFALPLTGRGTWRQAALRCTAAVVATAGLELGLPAAPSRRLVANAVAASLSVLDLAGGDGRERWFGPVYLMKVVGGHAGIPRDRPGP